MHLTASYTTLRIAVGEMFQDPSVDQGAVFNPQTRMAPPPYGLTQILMENGVPETEVFLLWDKGLQALMQTGQNLSTITPQMTMEVAQWVLKKYQKDNPSVQLPLQASRKFASGMRVALRRMRIASRVALRSGLEGFQRGDIIREKGRNRVFFVTEVLGSSFRGGEDAVSGFRGYEADMLGNPQTVIVGMSDSSSHEARYEKVGEIPLDVLPG